MPTPPDFSALDGHDRIALGFSGGKDSAAVLTMLREAGLLDRVTVYHLDTGDLLPEMVAHVARMTAGLPRFEHIQTDVRGWQWQHGLPSDLVPHTQHWIGHGAQLTDKVADLYKQYAKQAAAAAVAAAPAA